MHVESLGKPSTNILEALPGKLDIKRHSHTIFYGFVSSQTNRINQNGRHCSILKQKTWSWINPYFIFLFSNEHPKKCFMEKVGQNMGLVLIAFKQKPRLSTGG